MSATRSSLRDEFIDQVELPEYNRDWHDRMKELIKLVFIAEYVLGAGGLSRVTGTMWNEVDAMIQRQYDYLTWFMVDIVNKGLSEAQIMARARLYMRAATAAFERGQSYGLNLPQVPGDGQTECGVNCRCALSIEEDEKEFRVRWALDPACKHCRDCPELAATWNPLRIPKST